jgi:uncharacterized membrane protein
MSNRVDRDPKAIRRRRPPDLSDPHSSRSSTADVRARSSVASAASAGITFKGKGNREYPLMGSWRRTRCWEQGGTPPVCVEESVEVNGPLEEVFNYVSDVGNYPEWMADALEVRNDTAGPPRQGDRFAVAIKSIGRRFETPARGSLLKLTDGVRIEPWVGLSPASAGALRFKRSPVGRA